MTPEMKLAHALSSARSDKQARMEKRANAALAKPPMPAAPSPAMGAGMRPPTMGGSAPMAAPAMPSPAAGMKPAMPKMGSASFDEMSVEELEEALRSGVFETKTASVTSFEQADAWGRSLAREMAKVAFPGGGMVASGVGRLMHAAVATPALTRVAVGAGLGAATGAATSQDGSRLKGALLGAGLGGAAGGLARQGAIGLANNSRFAGNALKQTARQTGNIDAYRVARGAQQQRVQAGLAARKTRVAKAPAGAAPAAAPAAAVQPQIPVAV